MSAERMKARVVFASRTTFLHLRQPTLHVGQPVPPVLCISWVQIYQQEWKDHLDTVQLSGKQERNARQLPHIRALPEHAGPWKERHGVWSKTWFPAYANSANKKLLEGKGSEAKWLRKRSAAVQEAADALAAGYAKRELLQSLEKEANR